MAHVQVLIQGRSDSTYDEWTDALTSRCNRRCTRRVIAADHRTSGQCTCTAEAQIIRTCEAGTHEDVKTAILGLFWTEVYVGFEYPHPVLSFL